MAKKQTQSSKTIEELHAKVTELEGRVTSLQTEIVGLKEAAAKATAVHDAAKKSSSWENFKKWFT